MLVTTRLDRRLQVGAYITDGKDLADGKDLFEVKRVRKTTAELVLIEDCRTFKLQERSAQDVRDNFAFVGMRHR